MGATKMHADESETDVALVRRLLAGQFPQWADLRIDPVASYGTDHDIYRLGDHLSARLPMRDRERARQLQPAPLDHEGPRGGQWAKVA